MEENPKDYWNNYSAAQDEADSDVWGELGGSWLSRIWNDITGKSTQNKEFAQQEYLQDKQNEYNSPVNQMQRMIDAGINPNLAAQGISQGGNESAQAPAVASNAGGTSSGIAAVGGAVDSVANSLNSLASAKETNRLLALREDSIRSETIANLEKAGLDHWNALSIATLLPSMEANQVADFYIKLANFDNLCAQYQVLLDEHDLKLQEIRLTGSQADEAAENARFAKATTDFFVENKFRDDAPLDVSYRNAIVSGNKALARKIGQAIENASHLSSLGAYEAEVKTIQEKTRLEENEKLKVRLQEILANEQVQKDLMKMGFRVENTQELLEYLLKYLFGTGMSVNVGPFGIKNDNPK